MSGAQRCIRNRRQHRHARRDFLHSMLWIKRKRPAHLRKDALVRPHQFADVLPDDRRNAIDLSNASYTGVFSTVEGKNWSDELCREIGIDIESSRRRSNPRGSRRAETLRRSIACGVPAAPLVVIGGADSPCAALPAAVISPNGICQSVGTTNRADDLHPIGCCPTALFLHRCHGGPGLWVFQGAMSNAGSVVELGLRDAVLRP